MLWATGIWLMLFIAVIAGHTQWKMNSQPWDLWWEGYSLFEAWLALHQHALRYVIYWPMFVTAQGIGVHPDKVFTYASVFASLGLIWALIRCEVIISDRPSLWRTSGYAFIVVIMSLAMDGRITLLLAGYSAIIMAALQYVAGGRWGLGQSVALIGGGLLCSLSSGTLTVAGAFAGVWGVWTILGIKGQRASPAMLYALLGFFVLYGGWILAGLLINLAFFEHDAMAMLDHGAGSAVLLIGPMGPVALAIAALAGLWGIWWLNRKQSATMFVLTLALASAAVGGLFGLTTMSIGLVPALLAVRSELWNALTQRY